MHHNKFGKRSNTNLKWDWRQRDNTLACRMDVPEEATKASLATCLVACVITHYP